METVLGTRPHLKTRDGSGLVHAHLPSRLQELVKANDNQQPETRQEHVHKYADAKGEDRNSLQFLRNTELICTTVALQLRRPGRQLQ